MRKPMTKYWIFDEHSGQVHGPYWITRLKTMHGFGPNTKLAPQGATKPKDWKKARDIPEFQEEFGWEASTFTLPEGELPEGSPEERTPTPKPGENPKP